jgi:hypothetical protein
MKTSVPRRFSVAALLVLGVSCERASAHLPPPQGSTLAELVAFAEGEGARYPVDPTPPALIPYSHRKEFDPTAPRMCAESSGMGPARSGEFVIGGFLNVEDYVPGRPLKIWWAPLHHSKDMTLVVRGTRVGSPSDTLRFVSSHIAWNTDATGIDIPESKREYFFPSGVSFPSAGTWVVIATQGSDWGCFILTQSQ